jgi:hypothetical protein
VTDTGTIAFKAGDRFCGSFIGNHGFTPRGAGVRVGVGGGVGPQLSANTSDVETIIQSIHFVLMIYLHLQERPYLIIAISYEKSIGRKYPQVGFLTAGVIKLGGIFRKEVAIPETEASFKTAQRIR